MNNLAEKMDVLCIGAALIDLPVGPVDSSIFARETSFPVDGIKMSIGGDAINEATIISRLGKRAGLATLTGMDAAGIYIMDHCLHNNINVENIKTREEIDTGINIGLVTADGERTFITNRQGSHWKYCKDHFDMSCLDNTSVISFSFFNTPRMDGAFMETVFAEAKKKGILICADMIMPRLKETIEDIRGALQYVDYFFPNQDEASFLSGKEDIDEIADTFLACGVKHVVLKTGKKGCLLKSAELREMVPGYMHSKVVDTIGAGDNFEAGFIVALLEGKSPVECAQFAHSVASLSVEAPGATNGVTSRAQAEERYRQYLAEL